MAAGQGFKTFVTGEVLTSGDVNGYLMQGINVFTNATARDAAITAPAEGQFAFTKDNNSLWYYDGAAWVASGATGDIEGVTAGVGISGGGTSGTVTVTNSMATAIDAKGDLVPGTGADTFSRLAVGANDTVLTADSSTATGLKWASVAGGGMTLLSTTTLSGATTTISSINQGYVNLFVMISNMTNSTNDGTFRIGLNGATNSHDGVSIRYEQASAAGSVAGFANNYLLTPSNLDRANATNTFCLLLPSYADTTNGIRKTFNMFGRYTSPSTSTAVSISGMYGSTSAITSLAFSNSGGNWAGGTVLLYGVK